MGLTRTQKAAKDLGMTEGEYTVKYAAKPGTYLSPEQIAAQHKATLAQIDAKKAKYEAAKKAAENKANIVSDAKLLPLLPLWPVMNSVLSKKGVTYNAKSLSDTAKAFYDNVIVNRKENFVSSEDFNALAEYENFTGSQMENFDPVTITAIVSAIISFVKGILGKKKEGKPLSSVDAEIAKGAEEAESKPVLVDDSQAGLSDGKKKVDPMVIGGIALLAFLLFK